MVRGGSWNNNNARNYRSSNRNRNNPNERNNNLGFRVAQHCRYPVCRMSAGIGWRKVTPSERANIQSSVWSRFAFCNDVAQRMMYDAVFKRRCADDAFFRVVNFKGVVAAGCPALFVQRLPQLEQVLFCVERKINDGIFFPLAFGGFAEGEVQVFEGTQVGVHGFLGER
ncbi:MAG: hypothetical protein J5I98_11045 [Phaeodactylibacter sp.]|nr:hypothetical protein [Phaeodactylibacter sp.]